MESEYEDEDEMTDHHTNNVPATKISWLLQIVLENLGVTVSSYIVRFQFLFYRIIFFPPLKYFD